MPKKGKEFGYYETGLLVYVKNVLEEAGKPLTYDEIKEALQKIGYTGGVMKRRPSDIGHRIREDIGRRDGTSVFQVTGLYQVGLKEWGYPEFDKEEYWRKVKEERKANKRVTIMSGILDALEKNGEPMKVKQIYLEVMNRKDIHSNSKDLFKTVNSHINHELAKKGENSRFVRISRGLIGLRKWDEK